MVKVKGLRTRVQDIRLDMVPIVGDPQVIANRHLQELIQGGGGGGGE